MNHLAKATLLLLLLAALAGCSSLPGNKNQEPISESREKAAEYAQSGNAHLNKGDFAMAATFFEMSRDLNLSVDNLKGVADSYNSLAKVFIAAGEEESAEINLANAFRVASTLEDTEPLGRYYGLKGELLLSRGQAEEALEYFRQGLENLPKNSIAQAIILHNQASAFKKLGDFTAAVEAISEAIKINEQNSQFSELGANYYLLASIFSKQQDYPAALENAAKALENDKKVENSIGIAQDLFAFGRIFQKTGEWERAQDFFLRAFLVYETLGIRSKMLDTLPYLQECAEQLGDQESVDLYKRTKETLENL